MSGIEWVFDDGGRQLAGRRGRAGDCVTRAIAIAAGRDYADVYDTLYERTLGASPVDGAA